ncbi:MAG: hypothetical protein KF799_05390 [Bdellovibrionales bacterium]|nr:hypothetical protein [Bdellovibrionales bacterium]
MIETITGDKGHKVIRRAGRLLASGSDPVAEAIAWLARRRAFLDKVKTVFVLGLGSGYHVNVLLSATSAHLVVIEPDAALIEAVAAIHTFPKNRVRVECVSNSRSLRAAVSVREGVKQSFVVLAHPPSQADRKDLFADCAAQLNGRDWGSLTWQWKLKEGQMLDSTPRVDGHTALTIYDLEQTELVQNSEERERMLIKALRELVK